MPYDKFVQLQLAGDEIEPNNPLAIMATGFLAAGVWGDSDKAKDAVSTEASALRSDVLLSDQLPPGTGVQLRALVRRQIDEAVHQEWPAMARQHASLAAIPVPLAQALDVTVAFKPSGPGQVDAQGTKPAFAVCLPGMNLLRASR